MKVLVVLQNLNYKDVYNYPIGLFYLAAYLKNDGHSIEYLEFTKHRPTVDEIASAIKDKIEQFGTEIVMCGSLFTGWEEFCDIMDGAKKADKSLITIGGGGGITYSWNEFMKFVPSLDIGVLGEGELIASNLLDALQNKECLCSVKGIVYRDMSGNVKKNESGDFVQSLDSLPYPLLSPEFEIIVSKTRHMLVAGSRSCPFSCTFCCCVTSKKYRTREIDNIAAEVEHYIMKFGINKVCFIDELMVNNIERTHDFCEKITPLNIKFIFQTRASRNFTVDLFERLINAGMESFSFGVENTNDEILESMQKKTSVALLKHCFSALKASGANRMTIFNLLIGDPAETLKTFVETIRFLRMNYRDFKLISPALIKCYPGSQIYNDAVACKIIVPDEFFALGGYSTPIVNITKLSHGCFEVICFITIYERAVNRRNDDLIVELLNTDNEYFARWRCNCVEHNAWRTKQLGNWLEYTVGTEITFVCSYCDKIVVDIVKNNYYELLGTKLINILQTRKILFYGINEVIHRLLGYINDCDFIITAPELKFTADDWRIFERELYDENRMSDMIETKYISDINAHSLYGIDMVVVVSVNLYEDCKKIVGRIDSKLPVLMYSELLYV